MSRATFVKAARKDNPVAKVGESYWWWESGFRGPKMYSKTQPRPSQTASGDYMPVILSIQEGFNDCRASWESDYNKDNHDALIDEIQAQVEDWGTQIEDLGSEQGDKHDNMPEGLQQGDSGQMLEERRDCCESVSSDLQVDFDSHKLESLDEGADSQESLTSLLDEIDGILSNLQ